MFIDVKKIKVSISIQISAFRNIKFTFLFMDTEFSVREDKESVINY